MSRTDIANYLRLAPETVSRVLKRFNDEGMILVDRREVELADRKRLEDIAGAILQQS
jgi:CRP/FNR family transcriptional regulator